jgi:serine/threonine-protein kinase
VLLAHAHDRAVPLSEVNRDVPPDLEHVIMRCLSKSANDRFQTADELSEALLDCADAGRWSREEARAWWQQNTMPPRPTTELAMV